MTDYTKAVEDIDKRADEFKAKGMVAFVSDDDSEVYFEGSQYVKEVKDMKYVHDAVNRILAGESPRSVLNLKRIPTLTTSKQIGENRVDWKKRLITMIENETAWIPQTDRNRLITEIKQSEKDESYWEGWIEGWKECWQHSLMKYAPERLTKTELLISELGKIFQNQMAICDTIDKAAEKLAIEANRMTEESSKWLKIAEALENKLAIKSSNFVRQQDDSPSMSKLAGGSEVSAYTVRTLLINLGFQDVIAQELVNHAQQDSNLEMFGELLSQVNDRAEAISCIESLGLN